MHKFQNIYRDDNHIAGPMGEGEVMEWFHKNCSSSMDHSLKHEGYSIEYAKTVIVSVPDTGVLKAVLETRNGIVLGSIRFQGIESNFEMETIYRWAQENHAVLHLLGDDHYQIPTDELMQDVIRS